MSEKTPVTTFGAAVTAIISDYIGTRRISEASVAKAIGMSQTMMSRRMRGDGYFDVDQLAAICDALSGLNLLDVINEADAISHDRPKPVAIMARRRGA